MAKVVKDTRKTIDVDTELENIKKGKAKEEKKEIKKDKKKKEVKKTSSNKKHFKFLREVKSEMDKVKWPNKKDMVKYSIATIVFVIFFALFFYGIDLILALLKEVF